MGNKALGHRRRFDYVIDGKPITEPDTLARALSKKHPGDIIVLKVFRDGRTIDTQVKLGEAPEDVFEGAGRDICFARWSTLPLATLDMK